VLTEDGQERFRLWDSHTGKEMRSVAWLSDDVVRIALSPDETRVLTVSKEGIVRVWDTVNGKVLHTSKGGSSRGLMSYPGFSPDGAKVLIVNNDDGAACEYVEVCNTFTGEMLFILYLGSADEVESLGFSPDGANVFVAIYYHHSEGCVSLFNADTGRREVNACYLSLAFSDDGSTMIITPDDRMIITPDDSDQPRTQFWDVAAGKVMFTSPGDIGFRPVLSPDGSKAFTFDSGIGKLWDIRKGSGELGGIAPDRETAMEWFRKAAEQGHSEAQKALDEMSET